MRHEREKGEEREGGSERGGSEGRREGGRKRGKGDFTHLEWVLAVLLAALQVC